jgi:hypothetical protein
MPFSWLCSIVMRAAVARGVAASGLILSLGVFLQQPHPFGVADDAQASNGLPPMNTLFGPAIGAVNESIVVRGDSSSRI